MDNKRKAAGVVYKGAAGTPKTKRFKYPLKALVGQQYEAEFEVICLFFSQGKTMKTILNQDLSPN